MCIILTMYLHLIKYVLYLMVNNDNFILADILSGILLLLKIDSFLNVNFYLHAIKLILFEYLL